MLTEGLNDESFLFSSYDKCLFDGQLLISYLNKCDCEMSQDRPPNTV